jgi:hypothetical protein
VLTSFLINHRINEDINDLNSKLKPTTSKYVVEEIKKIRRENLKLFEKIQRYDKYYYYYYYYYYFG